MCSLLILNTLQLHWLNLETDKNRLDSSPQSIVDPHWAPPYPLHVVGLLAARRAPPLTVKLAQQSIIAARHAPCCLRNALPE